MGLHSDRITPHRSWLLFACTLTMLACLVATSGRLFSSDDPLTPAPLDPAPAVQDASRPVDRLQPSRSTPQLGSNASVLVSVNDADSTSKKSGILMTTPKTPQLRWLPGMQELIVSIEATSKKLPEDRQTLLREAASDIAGELKSEGNVGLNFICTHNSRRSHLSQLWAAVAAASYEIDGINCFSGGTEATACNERIVRSLRRAGISVVAQNPTAANPHYLAQFAESIPPAELFSKRYDDTANPKKGFFAMMCCSDADDKCPVVRGASGRVALHYLDPKASDGTDAEDATYDERRDQIAAEMFFMVRTIKESL